MGFKDRQWVVALTVSAAAVGVSLVAWKISRQKCGRKKFSYSLRCAESRGSSPVMYDHGLVTVYNKTGDLSKVYAVGGNGTASEHLEVWVLDSALKKWVEVFPSADHDSERCFPPKRFCHASAEVGTSIYVFGGYTSKVMGDVLKFDTEEGRWSTPSVLGDLPPPRSSHTATVVGKKSITPVILGNPPAPRHSHSAVLVNDERIVIYGGYSNAAENDVWFLEVDTPYVRKQREQLGHEVVAWSKGRLGEFPQPVVICGPSGVGKGTLISKLMKEFPHEFGFSVSHTTRRPRNMEQDGVHYHFTERSVMEAAIKEGKFLESADVHGNLYGTSIAAVEAVADAGKRCILDIDVQGAQLVKNSQLKSLFIFISPPSFEELEARLRGRGTETEEQIKKRLENAKTEMKRSSDSNLFDFTVINDSIDVAYEQLKGILGLNGASDANGFDRSVTQWQPEARSRHTSAVVNTHVIVHGGVTGEGQATDDLLFLDTSKLTNGAPGTTQGLIWSRALSRCDLSRCFLLSPTLSPRYGHRAVSVSATEVLLSGGFDGKEAFRDTVVLKLHDR